MFVPGKLFMPSLMFVGKAGSLSDLNHKHGTRLEKLDKEKQSSLLQN